MPRLFSRRTRLLWKVVRFLVVAFPVRRILPFRVWRTYRTNAVWCCVVGVAAALYRSPAHDGRAPAIIADVLHGLVLAALVTALVWLMRRTSRSRF